MPDYGDLTYALSGYGKKNNPYDYRRKFAYSMLQGGMDTSPIMSPWQGAARMAQALVGGLIANNADSEEQAANQAKGTKLAAAIAKMQTDPTGGLADLSAVEPELGARYSAQMAAKKVEKQQEIDDANKATSFLLPPTNGPVTAQPPAPNPGEMAGAKSVYDARIAAGDSPAVAAGWAANVRNESAFNPGAVNPGDGRDGSNSVGLIQWNGPRAQALQQFAAARGLNPNDSKTQMQYLQAEIDGTVPQSVSGVDPQFKARLAQARTPQEAAALISSQFIRPAGGQGEAAARGNIASNYYGQFSGPTQAQLNNAYAQGQGSGDQTQPVGTPGNPVQINSTGGPGYGAIPIPNARPGEGQPVPIPNYVPGTAQPQLAQGGAMPPNANGQGDSAPPVAPPQADPGAQFEAAARRAQQAGRGDIALKYIQMATQARETAAKTTLQHVDLGDSIGVMDPRSGQIVQRIPKGAAPGTGNVLHVDLGDSIGILDPKTGSIVQRIPKGQAGSGAYPGKDSHSAALNLVIQGTKDPNFVNTPEYASAWATLSQPHQSFDSDRGVMVTLPPMNLSWAPKPGFTGQPQGAPQAPPQEGAPPAANPDVTSGPAVVAPQQPSVAPVPGLPAKPPNAEQSLSAGFADRMANSNGIVERFGSAGTNFGAKMKEALPFGMGNYGQSPEYQQYKQARDDFINAQLRRESGAAIAPSEYANADKQYFPQPGDSEEVLKQKGINRKLAVEGMVRNAGQSYKPSPTVGGNSGVQSGGAPSQSDIDAELKRRGLLK